MVATGRDNIYMFGGTVSLFGKRSDELWRFSTTD